MTPGPWTEAHLSEMSWHDNHVHSVRIVEGEHGSGQLILDIGYILEWMRGPFEAAGFTQEAWGKVRVSPSQQLLPGEREDA